MRYPINQHCAPICDELLPFINLGQMIHVDSYNDTYRLESKARGFDKTYSGAELNAIHPRLAETARKAQAVMVHANTAFAVLRQNIRCWHGAIMLDSSYGRGNRYFFDILSSIESNDVNADMAIIRGKTFSTENLAGRDLEMDAHREEVHVVGYLQTGADFFWSDLERFWPGIAQQVKMCEELGFNPMETAQHCLTHEPGKSRDSTLALPDSFTYGD